MTYGFVDDRLTPERIEKALGKAVPMTREQVGVRLLILSGPKEGLDARALAMNCDRRAFLATILDLYRQLDAMTGRGVDSEKLTPYPAPSYPDLTMGC